MIDRSINRYIFLYISLKYKTFISVIYSKFLNCKSHLKTTRLVNYFSIRFVDIITKKFKNWVD